MESVVPSEEDAPDAPDAEDPLRMARERWRWAAAKASGRVALVGAPNAVLQEQVAERSLSFDVIVGVGTEPQVATTPVGPTGRVRSAADGAQATDVRGAYDSIVISSPPRDHDDLTELLEWATTRLAPEGKLLLCTPLGPSSPTELPGWYVGRLTESCRGIAHVDEIVVADGGIRAVLAPMGAGSPPDAIRVETLTRAMLDEEAAVEAQDRERFRLQSQVATLTDALVTVTARLEAAESEYVSELMRIRADLRSFQERVVAESLARDDELLVAKAAADKLARQLEDHERLAVALDIAQSRLERSRLDLDRMRNRHWWRLGQELIAVRRRPRSAWRLPARVLRVVRSRPSELALGSSAEHRDGDRS